MGNIGYLLYNYSITHIEFELQLIRWEMHFGKTVLVVTIHVQYHLQCSLCTRRPQSQRQTPGTMVESCYLPRLPTGRCQTLRGIHAAQGHQKTAKSVPCKTILHVACMTTLPTIINVMSSQTLSQQLMYRLTFRNRFVVAFRIQYCYTNAKSRPALYIL